jgi:hypothetical protein
LTTRPEASNPEADSHLDGFTRWRFRDVTVFGVRGEATLTGFATVFREFLADPTPLVLWDMRECSLSRLAHGRLRWLVSQLMRSDLQKRPSGRSAFVCPADADFNVLRILIAYAEANGYAIELAVFRDIDEARRWLPIDPSRDRLE